MDRRPQGDILLILTTSLVLGNLFAGVGQRARDARRNIVCSRDERSIWDMGVPSRNSRHRVSEEPCYRQF